ncbi:MULTISPECIES: very short patch repair endonuclease [Xanthomonas]|uniref:very short patch repair endonuclease n=1 Tax=Xanthomonas TaxID=338 RepID=UPI000CEDA3A8|nr:MULTISPECIES: very short patch repair endonuclease [Xanthomonas]PPT64312.1 very short patch repair endonuclease [Xanthomonas arboricola]
MVVSDTDAKRSAIMRSVKQKDTGAEMVVRRIAHAMGARYRLHQRNLPGRPDLVFPSRRLCVFVHGCFWHRHSGCRLASTPGSNVQFWLDKFARNVERDGRKEAELRAAGWKVETIWECETRVPELLRTRLREMLFPAS